MSEKKPSDILDLQPLPDVTRVIRGRKLLEYLDAEHERRAKFEQGTLQRLDVLERSQRDVLTRVEAMEPKPGYVERQVRAGLRIPLALPIPCSEQLPEPEKRVLFFVPAELPQSWRWKTGQRVPDGYHEPGKVWRDDETNVGDELKLYTADQVTHWMPMPGEP